MTANELYQELSQCDWWASQTRKVRWLASRYYTEVDTLDQIRKYLTQEQVAFIINLR